VAVQEFSLSWAILESVPLGNIIWSRLKGKRNRWCYV